METMALRRKFSPEFKTEAVRLAIQTGVAVSSAARDLGINDSVLRRWMKETAIPQRVRQGVADTSELAKEVARLRKENAKLKMERDIIKKALGYFAKDPQ